MALPLYTVDIDVIQNQLLVLLNRAEEIVIKRLR